MSNNIGKKPIKFPSDFKFSILKYPHYNTLLISSGGSSSQTQLISYPSFFHLTFDNNLLHISVLHDLINLPSGPNSSSLSYKAF
jgi:hypothetical protein